MYLILPNLNTKPYDYVVQNDLRIFQRASGAIMEAKTSGLLYKGVKRITNVLNFISDLLIMQKIKYFLLVYVYPSHFLNLKTQIFKTFGAHCMCGLDAYHHLFVLLCLCGCRSKYLYHYEQTF